MVERAGEDGIPQTVPHVVVPAMGSAELVWQAPELFATQSYALVAVDGGLIRPLVVIRRG